MQERLLTGSSGGVGGVAVFSEAIIWSCVCQLVSAIRVVHTCQLAVRTLRLQHILTVSQPRKRLRVRINCVGIVDALEFEARKHVGDLQQQDLCDLGYLILSMACGAEVTPADDMANVARWEGFLAQNYSAELHNLAMTLIRSGDNARGRARPPSIMDVSRALALRCMDEQEEAYRSLDRTERALSSEYESGRILRLLLKLGFINERPEFGPDRRWAQSGDCYVLTLFRDYGTFHPCCNMTYQSFDSAVSLNGLSLFVFVLLSFSSSRSQWLSGNGSRSCSDSAQQTGCCGRRTNCTFLSRRQESHGCKLCRRC